MRPIIPDVAFGELSINGLSLHTYAWCVQDIRPLYHPVAYVGENVVIDGAVELAYEYEIAPADHALTTYFTDVCDPSGAPYLDRFVGYETNIGLINEILTPPSGASFSAEILTPSGATLTADVQVRGFDLGPTREMLDSPFVWNATLHLHVVAGLFS